MTDMDSKQLKKIYAAIEVLRNIGVEPSVDQLSRLSQIEEDILQQAAKAFCNEVNALRRPFMLQLDYEPDNLPSLTIVIDDKVLPVAFPNAKHEEREVIITPQKPKHLSPQPIQAIIDFPAEPTPDIPKIEPRVETIHRDSQIKPQEVVPNTEPNPKEEPKNSSADDFFSSLYNSPADENKPKRTRKKYSLNGSRFLKKEELVFEIIKLYLKHHPRVSFQELQEVFNDDYCADKFKSIGFLVSEDDLEGWYYSGKYNFYHGDIPEYRLVSADGIGFYNYSSWTHETIIPIIELAESFGYRITTDK